MPEFEAWVDVDVDDFYYECRDRDKKALAEMLIEDGYASPFNGTNDTIAETDLDEAITKILHFRMQLTVEEEELIKKIGNRVCLYSL
jgi:hypothetical protein